MKRMFYKCAKQKGLEITSYKSYRVDYSQIFEVVINGFKRDFVDSYIIGEAGNKEWIIRSFNDFLIDYK